MSTDQDDADEQRLRGIEHIARILEPRLREAGRLYNFVFAGLLVANGGASIASLAFIAATWKDGTFYRPVLIPLVLFMAGFILVGLGAVSALTGEIADLKRMELAESWLQLHVGDLKSKREILGLAFSNLRSRMGIAGGALFILGCVVGVSELLCQS